MSKRDVKKNVKKGMSKRMSKKECQKGCQKGVKKDVKKLQNFFPCPGSNLRSATSFVGVLYTTVELYCGGNTTTIVWLASIRADKKGQLMVTWFFEDARPKKIRFSHFSTPFVIPLRPGQLRLLFSWKLSLVLTWHSQISASFIGLWSDCR